MSNESSKWFQHDIKEPKEKIVSSKIKGTYISRCLNLDNPKVKKRFKNNLYIGEIGDLDIAEKMYDTIVSFWYPGYDCVTYEHEEYLEDGKRSGDNVANRLHKNGFTHRKTKKHKEQRIWVEEFGWAGYCDVNLDYNLIMHYGPKKTPEELPKNKLFKVFEVKKTSVNNYMRWLRPEDLPKKYQAQLAVYLKEAYKNKITKTEEGHFLILTRDNPNNKRILDYIPNENLIKECEKNSEIFWEHIQNKTYPKNFTEPEKNYIEKSIELCYNEKRDWPTLSGIE